VAPARGEARVVATRTGRRRGLTSAEVAARRPPGGNRIARPVAWQLRKFLRTSLTERLVALLLLVSVVYLALGEFRDAAVMLVVIVAAVAAEAWVQLRADRAIASLSRLSAPRALVWRDGRLKEVPPDELVRDDVILLTAGSRVPADARLVEAEELLVDESLVTGESQPVEYDLRAGGLAELRAGTHVLRGRAVAVVTAVGRTSTLGRVASLVGEAEPQRTPLQDQMSELARRFLVVAAVASLLVPAVGWLTAAQPLRDLLLTGLTLAFASVPAELPVLVVAILGLGSLRLAAQGAIVRRLSATETLGTTTLICTDKTGTLTENRISLTQVVTASQALEGLDASEAELDRVRQLARLASEAQTGQDTRLADPIDMAVCRAARPGWPEPAVRFSFDSARRLASGLAEVEGQLVLGVKGAPEAVMVRTAYWRSADGIRPLDGQLKDEVIAAATELTAGGARVLAVASRVIVGRPSGGPSRLERELIFEGLLAFSDPLRPEVPRAVRDLQGAGVAITMVTGDQPATAAAIARAAGLGGPTFIAAQIKGWSDEELAARALQGCVVARARPDDKLRIVRAAAATGQVVAVTGDGVNDAPALEAAAIGVAMGRSSSDVAWESADLVLSDDSFATLARATAEGRRLHENLRKAIRYYLAVKLALVAVSALAVLLGRPLPFLPMELVLLELFLDLGAAFAFVHQPAESDEVRRRPRDPRARFLDLPMVAGILSGGLALTAVTAATYLAALPHLGTGGARAAALACWLVGHSALGLAMGWERRPLSLGDLAVNPAMPIWIACAALLTVLLLAVGSLADLLHLAPIPLPAALGAAVAGLVPPGLMELLKRVRGRLRGRPAPVQAARG
jgi:Ca2+-transporting ATPase